MTLPTLEFFPSSKDCAYLSGISSDSSTSPLSRPSYLNVQNELTIQQNKETTRIITKGWNLIYWFLLPKKNEPSDSYAVFKMGNGIRKSGSALFFFHLAFLFLIFIIVITFKQFTWNGRGNEINSCHPPFLLHKHCFTINTFAQENERTDSWGFMRWCLGEWEGDEWGIDMLVYVSHVFMSVSRLSHFSMTFNFINVIHGSSGGYSTYCLWNSLTSFFILRDGTCIHNPFSSNLQRAQD